MIVVGAICTVCGAFLLMQSLHLVVLFAAAILSPRKRDTPTKWEGTTESFPDLCIQLPVFNEGVEAAGAIGCLQRQVWPGRVQLQILDDSTDLESKIAVDKACAGFDPGSVKVLRRPHRKGFKAGALREGMLQSDAELFALFDADFRPEDDFCLRAWEALQATTGIGFVQGRWGHRNRHETRLTRSLAVGIDAHFSIEQAGRFALGGILNFNGTAGLWKREAIEAAGGWEGDTLTEDLDLSYRSALAGWSGIYLDELVVAAEIPPTIAVWIRQQRRWAQGSIQCLRKLGPRLLVSPKPLHQKVLGLFHLTHYLIHPAMVVLVMGISFVPKVSLGLVGWASLVFTLLSVPLSHAWMLRARKEPFRWTQLPGQTLLGMAATPHLAWAAVQGMGRSKSEFAVTPKGSRARSKSPSGFAWVDLAWATLLLCAWIVAYLESNFAAEFFLGWILVAWLGAWPFRAVSPYPPTRSTAP